MLTKSMDGGHKFLSLFIEPDQYPERKRPPAGDAEELHHLVCSLDVIDDLEEVCFAVVDLDLRVRPAKRR